MLIPNRHESSDKYRYGFQGQEKDDEVKGEGNSLNYKFRIYGSREGRFFSVDPLFRDYPWYTPYSFSGNKVIAYKELEGMEEEPAFTRPDYIHTLFWDAADGLTNVLYYGIEIQVIDEVEGRMVRSVLSDLGYEIPPSVSDKMLGATFQIRHRKGGTTESNNYVEPQESNLKGLMSLATDVLDVASIYPGSDGVFMAIKANPIISKTISNVLKGLKINARSKQILKEFKDIGGTGTFREIEAEGMAIFEETLKTTVRAIKNTDMKAGDFIIESGKFKGKSVDLVSAVENKGFDLNDFIKSIDNHYLKDGVDFVNIDIRKLDDAGKQLVKNHVDNLSDAKKARTIITE